MDEKSNTVNNSFREWIAICCYISEFLKDKSSGFTSTIQVFKSFRQQVRYKRKTFPEKI